MAGAPVVVKGGTLACSHQGSATVTSVSSRLTVAGNGVLLSGKEKGLDFTGCTNQTKESTPKDAPCVSDAATVGVTTKLTVGGTAVLLASAKGSTHPSKLPADPGTWKTNSASQSKLTAV